MGGTITTVWVAILVVLALCGTGVAAGQPMESESAQPGTGGESHVEQVENNTTDTIPPDPPDDVLGWEAGYWYNETIEVNQSDGLTPAETEAYLSRAMARVEYLRHIEFTEDVDVEVVSRSELVNRTAELANESEGSGAFWLWNNQVWEGSFIVGEDVNVSDAFDDLFGGAVLGYYDSETDELVVVSDNPDTLVIDNVTLIHELVHAAQDQQYNLSLARYEGTTQDEQLAVGGLIEGDANFVEELYVQQCQQEWECVETPASPPTGGNSTFNVGMLVVLLNQYSDGMAFVNGLVDQAGWERVDDEYERPPQTTEQIIHIEPEEGRVPIDFEDTAQGGWELFDDQGENGSDTLGEATIFSMFWYQAYQYNISVINESTFFEPDRGRFDYYNYTSAPSEGWANDRLFPYQNDGQFGYVWVTEWDSEEDAAQFYDAYVALLAGHGGAQVEENTWLIENGSFADAFHVELDGTAVTIVNGPEVTDLSEIRPEIDAGQGNATARP